MELTVDIESPGDGTRVQRLSGNGPFVVGRHEACHVHLRGDLVSRNHVVVTPLERGLKIRDVSSNGTLAGARVLRGDEAEVAHGTPLVVGTHRLVIRPAAVDAEATPTTSAVGPDACNSATPESVEADGALRREIHRRLLDFLDLAQHDAGKPDDPSTRPRVLSGLRSIIASLSDRIPPGVDRDGLLGELADEALGLGPLERFLADPAVTEVMVVDASTIYVEMEGRIVKTNARFTDDERVRSAIERIVTPLGRRIDESSPLVDARLKDGSRVNAIIRPLAIRGSCITIRKFARTPLTMDDLVRFGTLDARMARFVTRSVVARKNIVISGGTGSGKTTLLNVLSAAIPESERIVTIEDAAELRLGQPHVVSLEARPANMEGKGRYTIRDLVVNALRMRPDRIVVGECRSGEALDMLQAMNTGHEGSLTTTHANSPADAVDRLETLCLMSGVDLPSRAIREQIAKAIDLVVQQTRFGDGTRRVTAISEVVGLGDEGQVEMRPLFEFTRTGVDAKNRVLGRFVATGYLPSFLDQFIVMGLVEPGEPYL
ncbi:MAG TPA: ATPase, T2SS/T4P/T4SS family [Polyangiaceae bacterium]|jgi:pilus assembly protein CpaF